ncbi:MAG: chorismate synthase [Clostridia bacterium]|nr:chorismate synthase [Clostridia bacterium]
MSSMGNKVKIEIFGESHSAAIGMTLSGFPAGVKIDEDELYRFMLRRAPGRDATSTARKEADKPEFLCGIVNGVTTGAPITAIIRNTNQHSSDYEKLRNTPRPSHADFAAYRKYDGYNDIRGGGAFSGRLTAPLCIGGGLAKQYLAYEGYADIGAHALMIGGVYDTPFDMVNPTNILEAMNKDFPTLSDEAGEKMREVILQAKADGDSVGGIIECAIDGVYAGLGGPLFEGIESKLSSALFAIPGVKGVEFGSGFECAKMRGSEHNDEFEYNGPVVVTKTNNSGGIQGGITNGMPIIFRVAIKPTPSIAKPQNTVNLETKENVTLEIGGRHDPCIVARAVPVVEAVAALCIMDILEEN